MAEDDESLVHAERCDDRVVDLVQVYLNKLSLPGDDLSITTDRALFGQWLQRTIPYRIGGAYSMHPRTRAHRVFVHLARLDPEVPFAIEVVVAEELIHMRDHLRGDFRRHSHHGHDRIAFEVERVTGYTPAEQRSILAERHVTLFRYLYQCPRCRSIVPRRIRGTWSCRRCSRRFSPNLVFREIEIATAPPEARALLEQLNQKLLQRQ